MTITLIDISKRPRAPKINGATPLHRQIGSRLAMVHRYHLQELGKAEQLIRQIDAGEAKATSLPKAIEDLQLIENYRLFGVLCGQDCQMLTGHHTIEDRQIFPTLWQAEVSIRPVIEQLIAEHMVIHELIDRMADQSKALSQAASHETYEALKSTFLTLLEIVRSHFGYEETELQEALGYHNAV